jgi:hypothetical protein
MTAVGQSVVVLCAVWVRVELIAASRKCNE